MNINGKHRQTIWVKENNPKIIEVFDQRYFPHEIKILGLSNTDETVYAIKEMVVRGAPLIGVAAAYGMYLACLEAQHVLNPNEYLLDAGKKLNATRPTAVNLKWAIDEMLKAILPINNVEEKIKTALQKANQLKQDDIDISYNIGKHGLELIKAISKKKKGEPVNILTHCNAGWLATIDWGTALSPVYHAQKEGIDVHVWVDETRPRNQGANLTAFELNEQGIKHTLINDNTGGHLMQHGMVDIVLVGSDRTTKNGDVANKIGTYLKALAAFDNNIPFYIGLPSSSIDFSLADGVKNIPIETRNENEVKYIQGKVDGEIKSILICPESTPALNYGFDVTPAKYVTGLITERGISPASEEGLKSLFPENF